MKINMSLTILHLHVVMQLPLEKKEKKVPLVPTKPFSYIIYLFNFGVIRGPYIILPWLNENSDVLLCHSSLNVFMKYWWV